MYRQFRFILLPLLVGPSVATAQSPDRLVKGQRISVTSRCEVVRGQLVRCRTAGPMSQNFIGTMESIESGKLAVRSGSNNSVVVFPMEQVRGLDIVDGSRGNAVAGAILGLVAGAVIGGVKGEQQGDPYGGVAGLFVGAPAGLLVGALIGSAIRSDRWRPISMDDQHVRVRPRLDLRGFALTIPF